MWMTDKVPVQLQMGDALASLSQAFRKSKNVNGFFVAFFDTLRREWTSIDYLRLDKYLSLIRRMIHEWFMHLERSKWSEQAIDDFVDAMQEKVLMPVQPDGLRMHIAFVYLAELRRVGGALLDGKVIHELLSPFMCVLLASPSEAMFKATVDDVFIALCDRFAPLKDSTELDALERFQNLDLARIGEALFAMAADTTELSASHRKQIYNLARRYKQAAGVSSFDTEGEPAKRAKMTSEAAVASNKPELVSASSSSSVPKKSELVPVPQKSAAPAVKTTSLGEQNTKGGKKEKLGKNVSNTSQQALQQPAPVKPSLVARPAAAQDLPALASPEPHESKSKRRESGVSETSQKSVRFSHADVVGISKITRQMKQKPKVASADMGKPSKGALKKTSVVSKPKPGFKTKSSLK